MRSRRLLALLPLALILASCTRDPKVRAQQYVENGNKFFTKTKYKEASLLYRRALQLDMRSGDAWYGLGLTSLKLAAFADAINDLRRAVELQPNNADALAKLADLYLLVSLRDSKFSAALSKEVTALSQRMLEKDPNSYDGHRLLGEIALLSGNAAEAVSELQKANSVRPLQYDLVTPYFRALVGNREFPQAEKLAYEMIAKDKTYSPIYDLLYAEYKRQNKLDSAERILKLKCDNNPQRAQFVAELAEHYFLLGRRADMDAALQRLTSDKQYKDGHLLAGDFYFLRLRDLERAQEQYETAIKEYPTEAVVYERRLLELWVGQPAKSKEANAMVAAILKVHPKDDDAIAMGAILALATGDPQQIVAAVGDLQALALKMPQNHLLRYNLARAYAAKGDQDQARLQLDQAIKIAPDFLPARILLAKVYIDKGDSQRALEVADQVIARDSGNLQGHLLRSSALLSGGDGGERDSDKGREELAYLVKTFPQDADVQYQAGLLAYQDKDYQKAERIFDELSKANPGSQPVLDRMTEVLAAENRMDDAAEKAKAVAAANQFADTIGWIYIKDDRNEDAARIYRILVDREPKNATFHYHYGKALMQKGDKASARKELETALRNNPSRDDEPKIRELLGKI
jgi:tetratricopeptide (TPR) repeat protein